MMGSFKVFLVLLFLFGAIASEPQHGQQRYGRRQLSHRKAVAVVPDYSHQQEKVVPRYGEQLQNLDQASEYETPNYDYKYEIHGGGNYFGHEEARRSYRTQGRYHVLLPDGRRQIVSYYADETGYHPTITYEVVGVPNSSPQNTGYRNKRSRYFKESKRVSLKDPVFFKPSKKVV